MKRAYLYSAIVSSSTMVSAAARLVSANTEQQAQNAAKKMISESHPISDGWRITSPIVIVELTRDVLEWALEVVDEVAMRLARDESDPAAIEFSEQIRALRGLSPEREKNG